MNLWFSQITPYLLLALLPSQNSYSDPALLAYHLPEAGAKPSELLQIPVIPYGQAYPSEYSPKLAYSLHMTPPVTPRPSCPQEHKTAATKISTQLLGSLYTILTGLINSMIPANGPWALLGKIFSYIVKLAPILWWALPHACGVSSCRPA
ncbi:hypothetical protein DSO57_1013168 [Entomophthora muscae]|uniref:Uncharacterized protein n=1 Tax=Entomophthora muscae TaxID=34485 RepID=A0ACC2UFE3_9FUNG|nr:hypothetical protein DSO57_1013168 [Entomophthora muscae]